MGIPGQMRTGKTRVRIARDVGCTAFLSASGTRYDRFKPPSGGSSDAAGIDCRRF